MVRHPLLNRGFSSTISPKAVVCALSQSPGSFKSRSWELIKMSSTRKISLIAGALYLLTFVSIPILFLYSSVRGASYIVGPGPDSRVFIGVVLEMIVALAGIGTAVALYPVIKRQNEGVALGFVGVRTLEAATIFAGVVTLLAVVALRQAGAGAGALATGQTLVGLHDWIFTLGQSLFPAVNALLLGSLLYQSRLVPRVLPCLLYTSDAAGDLLCVDLGGRRIIKKKKKKQQKKKEQTS